MGRRGCPPLFPLSHCVGEWRIVPPPPPVAVAVAGASPLGVGLGPPVLLYLQPLTLPHCPSGGDRHPVAQRWPPPLPPHCHPPGTGGPAAALVEPPPPPFRSCPLLYQPGGDALKNIEQPLGGGRGGVLNANICLVLIRPLIKKTRGGGPINEATHPPGTPRGGGGGGGV